MAGSISLSLSQQFDALGKPLSDGRLYFYQAGTVATPQNAFQDSDLTIPYPNPIILDSAGRVPQFYLADGQIKIRLTNSTGLDQIVADNILVIGPSSGGGGGGGVDPTTVLSTGDMKIVYGTGSIAGFVRANGRTIGSSTSGATERANADCQALFVYLWGNDPNLTVGGGRGASGIADWTANKTLTLPDLRGRGISGLDDMGNSAAGRLTSAGFGSAATTLGVAGGTETKTLATANLPPYTPSGTISGVVNSPLTVPGRSPGSVGAGVTGSISIGVSGGSDLGDQPIAIHGSSLSGNINGNAQGGTSTPISAVMPTMVMSIYVKL